MPRFFILLIVLLLAGCSPAQAASVSDLQTLQQLGERAEVRVQEVISQPILRQVNTDLETYTFFYANAEGTSVYLVNIPSADASSSEWSLVENNDPRLLDSPAPGMELGDLKVGAQPLADALRNRWKGCSIRGLTLYFDLRENDLKWVGFCEVEGGLVSGSLSNKRQQFVPVDALPATLPPTAEPL